MMAGHSSRFLYEELDTLVEHGASVTELPGHINLNLAGGVILRDYQEAAIKNFLTYVGSPSLRKNKQLHTLFHMATGSGKTVIMAALILQLYTMGYRRFLFLVDRKAIVEKTRLNFLDSSATKYLFAHSVIIDGRKVPIQEVRNFAVVDEEAINICFDTVSGFHSALALPKENGLSLEDFADHKVAILADEAHHVNTMTKNASKDETENERSWEYSVQQAFAQNSQNALLEFTATANLKDENVLAKYRDKIVYNFTLAEFRESGRTKEFQNFQSGATPWQRVLMALVLSEYRRSLAADARLFLKPIVMVKADAITASHEFREEFFERLSTVTPQEILALDGGSGIFSTAVEYFKSQDKSLESLVLKLRLAFDIDRTLAIDSKTATEDASVQIAVNTLEDEANPYRLVFAVDKLNEGWDVLNLYDIVRLSQTKRGKSYTTREAQLIGRAARYNPFVVEEGQEADKRKYDGDIENPFRVLETMYFHSIEDSEYISDLRRTLTTNGLINPDLFTVTYRLKDEFKQSDFWHNGFVFSNRRIERRGKTAALPHRLRIEEATVTPFSGDSRVVDLLTSKTDAGISSHLKPHTFRFDEIPLNLLIGTLDEFTNLRFAKLKEFFPDLSGSREFLVGDSYLGAAKVHIRIPDGYPICARDLRQGIRQVLEGVAKYLESSNAQYEGSREFFAQPIREVLRDKTLNLKNRHLDGLGISQREVSDANLFLDLEAEDWYVFNDNYGTTEEKHFVRYLSGIMKSLKEKYQEVFLVRNERFAELAIYEFETGERFEPDFLLFLRKSNGEGLSQEQIYVEPKGQHLLEQDAWKGRFLEKIKSEARLVKTYVDSRDYRIVGVPLYSHADSTQASKVEEAFREIASNASRKRLQHR